MEFISELGLFSGKVLVLALGFGVILILFFALLAKARHAKPILSVENLNDRFDNMARALKSSILSDKELKDFEVATKFHEVQERWTNEQKAKGIPNADIVLKNVTTILNDKVK